jgi:hypothetical protein
MINEEGLQILSNPIQRQVRHVAEIQKFVSKEYRQEPLVDSAVQSLKTMIIIMEIACREDSKWVLETAAGIQLNRREQ